MSGANGSVSIPKDALEAFAAALLRAGGFAEEHARRSAELLVWANLRGAESHGVLRIPRYIEMVEQGIVNGDAQPRIAQRFGAVTVIEGDRVPGASGMYAAAETAISLAADHGIGLCSIVRTSHAGAVGYFAEQVARAGMIGIAMSASKPLMIYHGARVEGVSTNPLAIGVPRRDAGRPLLLDMSTAAVALGKIMAAKDAGRAIPPGWGVDVEGAETTDPAKVKAVLPMAGAKGSGLSLMIEVVVSILAGNPIIATALGEKRDAGFNGSVIALDPRTLGAGKRFEDDVERLASAIVALPPAQGVDAVRLPGERGYHLADERLACGIPIAAGTATRLAEEARRWDVALPSALA